MEEDSWDFVFGWWAGLRVELCLEFILYFINKVVIWKGLKLGKSDISSTQTLKARKYQGTGHLTVPIMMMHHISVGTRNFLLTPADKETNESVSHTVG